MLLSLTPACCVLFQDRFCHPSPFFVISPLLMLKKMLSACFLAFSKDVHANYAFSICYHIKTNCEGFLLLLLLLSGIGCTKVVCGCFVLFVSFVFDLPQQPEGSYKIGSVRPASPSVCPSVWAFSWHCIISFFKILVWCQKSIRSCG